MPGEKKHHTFIITFDSIIVHVPIFSTCRYTIVGLLYANELLTTKLIKSNSRSIIALT